MVDRTFENLTGSKSGVWVAVGMVESGQAKELLQQSGLRITAPRVAVLRVLAASAPARFELRVRDNHHHAVCRICGALGDVDPAVGDASSLEPSGPLGFHVDEAEFVFWGICPDCQPGGGPEGEGYVVSRAKAPVETHQREEKA